MPVTSHRVPLLRDSHTHPLLYSAWMDALELRQANGEPREQVVSRIRSHAQSDRTGWAIAYGWRDGAGGCALAKEDFDDLAPTAILNISLHKFVLNDAGRTLLRQSHPNLVDNLEDQDWVECHLREILNAFARRSASVERLQRFFQRRLLEENGIYFAEELLLVDDNEVSLFEQAGLVERTRFWAGPEEYERLPPQVRQRIHGIKFFADGALGASTAAMHQPYRDSRQHGQLMWEPQQLAEQLARYSAIDMPLAIHAIGDRAIDLVVSLIEAMPRRPLQQIRIEHAQLISEPTAQRAKALGIVLSMQPNFSDDSIQYADRLPDRYPERNNPFRMLIDRAGFVPGKDLLFGSDGMPHGFYEGLRQSLFPRYPGQRLTLDEFRAGYCLPDERHGYIDLAIDWDNARVDGHVVTR